MAAVIQWITTEDGRRIPLGQKNAQAGVESSLRRALEAKGDELSRRALADSALFNRVLDAYMEERAKRGL